MATRSGTIAVGPMRFPLWIPLLTAITAAIAAGGPALAQTPPTTSATPSATPAAPTPAAPVEPVEPAPDKDPAVDELELAAARVLDFAGGTLDLSVDPKSLFDVDPLNERAVVVEMKRIRLLLRAHDENEPEAAEEDQPNALPNSAAPNGAPANDAPANEDGPTADSSEGEERDDPIDPLLDARLALDRARLDFYELPLAERTKAFDTHAARLDEQSTSDQQLAEATKKAEQAEKDRQAALNRAREAVSESLRAVAEEEARLLEIERQQAELDQTIITRHQGLNTAADDMIAWDRRVTEALDGAAKGDWTEEAIDALYDELARKLRSAQSELDVSLMQLSTGSVDVPSPGPERLASIPAEVPRKNVDAQRTKVLATVGELRGRLEEVVEAEAKQGLTEVEALNVLRLRLLPYLSNAKRQALVGFGEEGRTQARNEAGQVALVLRYHLNVSTRWIEAVRQARSVSGSTALSATWLVVLWLVPIVLFIGWRRRAAEVLINWRQDVREEDRRRLGLAKLPTWRERAIRALERIRSPLEWLGFVVATSLLLPDNVASLLELSLLQTVLLWSMGGALVVRIVDAIARDIEEGNETTQTADARFRSLRLIGRAIATVGMTLGVTDQLVGQGTIYRWVTYAAALLLGPVLLVIVAWWRDLIFARLTAEVRTNPFERWVIAQEDRGPILRYIAASLGGTYLIFLGIIRLVRGRAISLRIVRQALAYLFRRGMRGRKAPKRQTIPLDNDVWLALGPETRSKEIVESVADKQVDQVIDRINLPGGGVFAIVGERGAGKTSIVHRIAARAEAVVVPCEFAGDLEGVRHALAAKLGSSEDASFEALVDQLDEKTGDRALILDDAHHLMLPMMGGLHDFDVLLNLARTRSEHCTWIFAIDESIFRFLKSSRGLRPLFDDVIRLSPWSEDAIARLIEQRSQEVEITPRYEDLLAEEDREGDDATREDAVARTAASYRRLLWDYAGGNPGIALHFWRRSLKRTKNDRVFVAPFDAPDAEDLEELPDNAGFVLRAMVQLDGARPQEVQAATNLSSDDVADVLRFGSMHGLLERQGPRYRLTWDWLRAVTRFLRRRHLLSALPPG